MLLIPGPTEIWGRGAHFSTPVPQHRHNAASHGLAFETSAGASKAALCTEERNGCDSRRVDDDDDADDRVGAGKTRKAVKRKSGTCADTRMRT